MTASAVVAGWTAGKEGTDRSGTAVRSEEAPGRAAGGPPPSLHPGMAHGWGAFDIVLVSPIRLVKVHATGRAAGDAQSARPYVPIARIWGAEALSRFCS